MNMNKLFQKLGKLKSLFVNSQELDAEESHLQYPSPKIKQSIISNLRNEFKYKVFIETGTYLGDMVEAQKLHFDHVYSIELGEALYTEARKRFSTDKNVNIILGDSGKVLRDLMPTIKQPAIFWLDGHYSEGVTAKGEKECPIYEELDSIFAAERYKHVLLIDDARLFVGKNDYPTISELETHINLYRGGSKIFIKNDIIHVLVV